MNELHKQTTAMRQLRQPKTSRAGQIKFVRELSKNIANQVIDSIKKGRVPDSWDGHEFRLLLAEKHASSGRMSSLSGETRSSRARDYRNTVNIQNL